MNTASQNLPHHVGLLRDKLQHPTDYEKALSYFLEEFAGDEKFMQQSEPEEAPHLLGVLNHVVGQALGKPVELGPARVLRLPKFGFIHGSTFFESYIILFLYFEELDTGLMAIIPGPRGGTEVGRFRLIGALAGNPKHN